jgi:hypothetical protein
MSKNLQERPWVEVVRGESRKRRREEEAADYDTVGGFDSDMERVGGPQKMRWRQRSEEPDADADSDAERPHYKRWRQRSPEEADADLDAERERYRRSAANGILVLAEDR